MTEKNIHVLIIDDEISILKMLQLKLSRLGFFVDTAESGEEGVEKINSNKYSLILTDIKMPGVSGNQILQYVKDEKKSLIPVVGMSGTPWLLDKNDFDAILSKPCSLKETAELLCLLIKKER